MSKHYTRGYASIATQLTFLILSGMYGLSVSPAYGQAFPTRANSIEIQLTFDTSPNSSQDPVVKNGWVAWATFTPNGVNIFAYQISTKQTVQVTTDGTGKLQAIDGNTIVYSHLSSTNLAGPHNIVAYDLVAKTYTQLSSFPSNQFHPAISGNIAVWDDDRGYGATPNTAVDIWGVTFSGTTVGTEFPINQDPGIQELPSISGNLVTWQDLQSTPAVYAALLTGTTPGTKIPVSTTVESLSPRVDGNHIVYAKMVDSVNRFHNIFVWDATTAMETQVSSCACDQRFPRISGNRIVWEDNRNFSTTGWDLYGADLGTDQTDIPVDTEPLDQSLHDFDGMNVVFSDARTGTENIFLLTLGGRSYAYVANVLSSSVSVIDTQNNTVVATVPVSSFPTNVAVTPNGAFAYVTSGILGVLPPPPSVISVINTATNTVVATVPVAAIPLGLAITPNGAFAYVADFSSNSVLVINTASNTVVATVPVGFGPENVAITPNGAFAYVSNEDSNNVSVINTATNTVVATVPVVGSDPGSVAVTPNGAFAYVSNEGNLGTSTVSVISTATNTLVSTLAVPSYPGGVAITPNGEFAYVADASSGFVGCACNVLVINTATNTVVATVPVGIGPRNVAFTPDGAFAYVTNGNAATVSVINTATNTVVATVPVGGLPLGIAIGVPITPPPLPADFSLSSIPPLTLSIGGSGSTPVTVNSVNGFSSPVTLSASAPNGVSPSFTVNPVTPPSGGSASSALDVSVGPSVTPSTFTLAVTGSSGSLTHSAPVSVTVTVDTSSITSVIGNLLSAGCIDNSGIGTALTSKLAEAQAAISAGNIQTAINTLTALKNQLQAQSGKHIATTCTIGGVTFNPVTVLLMDVQSLIDSLRTSITADPITGYVVNSSGLGIPGATVSITDTLGNTAATATTDITGFYFFPTTGVLALGASYTVKVSGFPSGFTTSASAFQTFTWSGSGIALSNFALN